MFSRRLKRRAIQNTKPFKIRLATLKTALISASDT
jgi:hypothetical protein